MDGLFILTTILIRIVWCVECGVSLNLFKHQFETKTSIKTQ